MTVQLDHFIVPTRDKWAAANRLASILGLPWGEAAIGPFVQVHINSGLTLDFRDHEAPLPRHHYCFRVDDPDFNEIWERLKAMDIPYRSSPSGPMDMQINTQMEGKNLYWSEPDGHTWELLTVSYARAPN